jgi:hypothetical protein
VVVLDAGRLLRCVTRFGGLDGLEDWTWRVNPPPLVLTGRELIGLVGAVICVWKHIPMTSLLVFLVWLELRAIPK